MSAVVDMAGRAPRTLPGRPESVRAFRELAREAAASQDQAEAAALCVSELVTNALVHTRSGLPGGTVAVQFELLPGCRSLHIRVQDDGTRIPTPPTGGGLAGPAESGYGLGIVATLADYWGVTPTDDGRSVTWCVIPIEGQL
jgi:anti-sigma regulatory factor (Ser/Thr protein kinase)